jgi:predicted Zn-dependent peptidase
MIPEVKKNVHKHPYRWTTIGSMDHLDAKLEEFKDFNKKFYHNNAVLVKGDFNAAQKKNGSKKYFGVIKKYY